MCLRPSRAYSTQTVEKVTELDELLDAPEIEVGVGEKKICGAQAGGTYFLNYMHRYIYIYIYKIVVFHTCMYAYIYIY